MIFLLRYLRTYYSIGKTAVSPYRQEACPVCAGTRRFPAALLYVTEIAFVLELKPAFVLWRCVTKKITHQCQSKTLSSPDFESTYTNRASLEALAVC